MKLSGERFDPIMTGAISLEHRHRYNIVRDLAKNKRVLDVASGEGYGSYQLATTASHVLGVDISSEAISEAKLKYKKKNLNFEAASCLDIPAETNSIDLVVSFETIEHISEHEQMLLEIDRVLVSDGVLVISSPDKKHYSDLRSFENHFHIKELYRDEFYKLLQNHFKNIDMYSHRTAAGSVIIGESKSSAFLHSVDGSDVFRTDFSPHFNLAVCSNWKCPDLPTGIFEPAIDASLLINSFAVYEDEKNNAEAQITYRDELIEELKTQLSDEKNNAEAQITYRDELIEELKAKLSDGKGNIE